MPRRKAFTVLELLVVVGIIGVLITLVIGSLRSASDQAKVRSTRQTLGMAKSLLSILEKQATLVGLVPVGPLTIGRVGEDEADRYGPGVLATSAAMARIRSIPENKQVLEQTAASQLLKPGGGTTGPVLLDAWFNPVILVAAEGLSTTVGGATKTIVSRDGKPFFASAGPDGDFAAGDDNVYSFEN